MAAAMKVIKGKQPDKAFLANVIRQQQQQAHEVHEQDQAALKMLLDRERKQAAQLQEQREELDRVNRQLEAQKLNEAPAQ